uniref:zinc-binding protein A33-like n=1 Tax=Pristiophorus japonicus TaxID=55135 RepID=UPI00398EE670
MESELSCAVCYEIYKDPVLLDCDHSFCRSCITRYWESSVPAACPVCRRGTTSRVLRPNRTLANIVETFVKSGKSDQNQQECSRHKEKMKLFCKTDKQPICLVCQSSKSHQNHEVLPLEEATEEFKKELRTLLKLIQDKKKERDVVKSDYEKTLAHIQDQSSKTEKQMKVQFEILHQFLREEEKTVLEDLKLEKEKNSREMEGRIEKITEEISSLSVIVQDIEHELSEQDSVKFLTKFPETEKRAKRTLPEPQQVSPLINVGKYIGSLQYRVWRKMLTVINTAPVTLDPNTASPYLVLSTSLHRVKNTEIWQQLPDNPERFDSCVSVLGAEGFTSGTPLWEVEVGEKTGWDVGVVKETITRKGQITLTPSNGFWVLSLRNGNEYWACAEQWERLHLTVSPRKIIIFLDYEGGKVYFYNSGNMSHIYTFTGTFTEKLYPYFSPFLIDGGKNTGSLRICSQRGTYE